MMLISLVMLFSLLQVSFKPIPKFDNGTANTLGIGDIDKDGGQDVIIGKNEGLYIYYAEFNWENPDTITKDTIKALTLGDINNDGRMDIVVSKENKGGVYEKRRKNFIFHPFTNLPATMIALSDIDLDGNLDIGYAHPSGVKIFKNIGNFSFSEFSNLGKGRSIVWCDFNLDRYPDVAIGKEDGVEIFKNDSGKKFTPIYSSSSHDVYGISWIDVEGDGDFDLVCADSTSGNNFILVNKEGVFIKDDAAFQDEPASIGIATGDFDHNGLLDVCFARYNAPNIIYFNTSTGWNRVELDTKSTFTKIIASGDMDGDGDEDIVAVGKADNTLYSSLLNDKKYLQLKLIGRFSNRSAIGARVSLKKGNKSLVQEVKSGDGFASCGDLPLNFGVLDKGYSLIVYWPKRGIRDSLYLDSIPQSLTLYEDFTPPLLPDSCWSTTHSIEKWSNKRNISFSWTSGKDPQGSGIRGYSIIVDTLEYASVDSIPEVLAPDTSFDFTFPFGKDKWYFHLGAVDSAYNISKNVFSLGPFKVDFEPPSSFQLLSPPDSTITNRQFITFIWNSSYDDLSGTKGYNFILAKDSDFQWIEIDTFVVDTFFSFSKPLTVGEKFWKVIAADSVGNKRSSPTYFFKIDTIPPQVKWTHPEDKKDSVPFNTIVWVRFTKIMDTTYFRDNISFRGEKSGEHKFKFNIIAPGWYEFQMEENFKPFEKIICTFRGELRDIAGNRLDGNKNGIQEGSPLDDYDLSFTTGNPDFKGPEIKEVIFSQNPIGPTLPLFISLKASDIGYGGSIVTEALFFVEDTLSADTNWMRLKDGIPNSPLEEFETTTTSPSKKGKYLFFFKAKDLLENWSKFYPETLIVTPLQLQFSLQPKTLQLGDTLAVEIVASQKLAECWIDFFKDKNRLKKYHITSLDSLTFKGNIEISNLPLGDIKVIANGKDLEGNVETAESEIRIVASPDIVDKLKTFVYPNPAEDVVNFQIYLYENSKTTLSIFTPDGKKILTRNFLVPGGTLYSYQLPVKTLSPGVYIYTLTIFTQDTLRRETILEKFAIVR